MKIKLAGFNLDSTVIEELKSSSPPREDITPETLSAAYARISRHAAPVDELRAMARSEVSKARRSNKSIIFKMGHHSVAEHAVFNFDILGVSRLAIEEIEKFRLCSYTEKSQRYITLENDFVIPEEIERSGRKSVFLDTIKSQNELYHSLNSRLNPYFFDKYPEMAADKKKHALLEGWAKEDARYVVSLATAGQLGMTVNARSLEFMIRRFSSKESAELQEFNRQIYKLAHDTAPSIILFTEANDFDALTYKDIEKKAAEVLEREFAVSLENVSLVEYPADGDVRIAAALLHSGSRLPYSECRRKAESLSVDAMKVLITTAFRHMEFYDFVLREFEYANLTFDLIVSATCFAQLKRHRMATLTCQPYDPDLGVTIPPSIKAIGAEGEFMEVMDLSGQTYQELKKGAGWAAAYVLTNAHRKRVLFQVNARELYHVSRLREDATAQWDIRDVVRRMCRTAADAMPLTFMLLGGKDNFPDLYKKLFGRDPKIFPPPF